ncbi:MAG TPA: hypothetical protein PK286_00490 [Devosia sp.]|nr:hypothetical protein [Devosia sp.]
MDALCLIASPRTGTRHLSEVLRNIEGLASYLDVFDPAGASGIDETGWPLLRTASGVPFGTPADPALSAFARSNPAGWLDALEQATAAQGKRFMSFRLLDQHLPTGAALDALMSHAGLRVVMVVRKQIDAYVSWRKGSELNRWRDVDTTGFQPELDADHFERWLDGQQHWYEMWRSHLSRNYLPAPIVRYELDIDQPPEQIARRFVAIAAQVGVALKTPATLMHRGLMKQDRSTSAFDKVRNWTEFSREIFSRGLERRAFGYPL